MKFSQMCRLGLLLFLPQHSIALLLLAGRLLIPKQLLSASLCLLTPICHIYIVTARLHIWKKACHFLLSRPLLISISLLLDPFFLPQISPFDFQVTNMFKSILHTWGKTCNVCLSESGLFRLIGRFCLFFFLKMKQFNFSYSWMKMHCIDTPYL